MNPLPLSRAERYSRRPHSPAVRMGKSVRPLRPSVSMYNEGGTGHMRYVFMDVQGQSQRHKAMRRMRWYSYLGWMLVGMFLLFFGVGMLAGIAESQVIIPIVVILALAAGLILV